MAWWRIPMAANDSSNGIRGMVLIRLAVGLIFFSQGILKFIDTHLGIERFTKIGFPHPAFTAHFVGTFEAVCGLLPSASSHRARCSPRPRSSDTSWVGHRERQSRP